MCTLRTSNASRPQSTPLSQTTPDRAPTRCHNGNLPQFSRLCIFETPQQTDIKRLHAKLNEKGSVRFLRAPKAPRLNRQPLQRAIFPGDKGTGTTVTEMQ
jgi:hypothetical protein